jgi:hypothetical protein
MNTGQESVQEVVVILAEIFQLLESSSAVEILLAFVFLESWGSLIDFTSKSEIWSQNTSLDVFVVALDKVSDCLGDFSIEWRESVLKSEFLFQNPSVSALLDKEAGWELAQKTRIYFAKIDAKFKIFGEESVPLSVAFR